MESDRSAAEVRLSEHISKTATDINQLKELISKIDTKNI
jgi:hypothetical protein